MGKSKKKSARTRRVPEGQPSIAPALRNDWCTSDNVLCPVYDILGPTVGIDPASNSEAIVMADTKIFLPEGAVETDIVGGLAASWHEHRTFFCNPPFGDGVINLWVAKAIEEAKLGAEGIMLLPAYVSSYFFADIWNSAQVICFWGLPGETPSRVKFLGAKDSANFPIMLVYFGPNYVRAADVLARVGQVVPPWVVQGWLNMIRGDVIPSLRQAFDEDSFRDPIYVAMRRACRHQYDDLITACGAVESKTIAELVSEDHPLIDQFLGLTVGEIAGGLAALQRVEPVARDRPTSRRSSSSRSPRKTVITTDATETQLSLISVSPSQAKREDLDRKIIQVLRSNETGLLAAELRKRVNCTPGRFRTAVERLIKQSMIFKHGTTGDTRYYATRHH